MIASTVLLQLKIYIDLSLVPKVYIIGTQVKFRFWVETDTLGGGDFFSGATLKFRVYIKNNEYESERNNNNKNSNSNFCNFSLLVTCPNNFVVVCLCIIFHGMEELKIFFISCSHGLVDFLGAFCIRKLRTSIMPSMTNHVNSRIAYGEIISFMCVC